MFISISISNLINFVFHFIWFIVLFVVKFIIESFLCFIWGVIILLGGTNRGVKSTYLHRKLYRLVNLIYLDFFRFLSFLIYLNHTFIFLDFINQDIICKCISCRVFLFFSSLQIGCNFPGLSI